LAFSGRDIVVLFLQPKDFVLHLFALLIIALWCIEWALGGYRLRVQPGNALSLLSRHGADSGHLALTAAAFFGLVVVISTILSPLPAVSMWGRNFSELGYDLYSVLSCLVLFFVIALRVRTEGQVRRILWVISIAGMLAGIYGISQRYGWDPIGNGAGESRVVSSFGNPIFFGSYLVMSTIVTLGLALDSARKNNQRWLVLVTFALGVQFTAIWFTGSRGPWIGLVIGLFAFAFLSAITLERRRLVTVAAVAVSGLLMAFVVVNVVEDNDARPGRGFGSVVTGLRPTGDGLSGRNDIWDGSFRLLDSWEVQQTEGNVRSWIRPVFGLGPEMYFYSYPLVANPQYPHPEFGEVLVGHTHNFPLQLLFGYGLLGLFTFVVMAISILAAGIAVIRRKGADGVPDQDWLVIATLAIAAALIGRAAEQTTGVARIGDLAPFWVLTGAVVATYRISRGRPSGIGPTTRGRGRIVPVMAAAVVSIAVLGIFMSRDVQMLRAGLISSKAFDESAAGNTAESTRLLMRAAELAPDVQQYYVWAGELLLQEARLETDPAQALSLLGEAYETFVAYENRDPYAFTTQLRIGLVEAELVSRGDPFRLDDLIERSVRLSEVMPSYPSMLAIAADRVLIGSKLEIGLEMADRAISMETDAHPQILAWLLRGNALGDSGELNGALESFKTALDREPEGQLAPRIHTNMALVYDAIGNPTLAIQHRDLAAKIQAALISGPSS
jgi:O-antigen ligase/tetratricopeptide (TPR) repeat protein